MSKKQRMFVCLICRKKVVASDRDKHMKDKHPNALMRNPFKEVIKK